MRECSLTPNPASIGLAEVRWHQAGVSKGDPPMWVRADVTRGRRDVNRRSDTVTVFEPDRGEVEPAALFGRSGSERRHDPRELQYHGGGFVVAVNGRRVNR